MDYATPAVFATARDGPDEVDATFGRKLEIKTYESHYNYLGNRVRLQAGTRRMEAKIKEEDHESALVLTRYYDRDKVLSHTTVEVKSPHMITALQTVIKNYPGLSFKSGKVILRDQPRCIFHFRTELRQYGMNLGDPIAGQHLLFLLNYMYNTLSDEITNYYAFMESPSIEPGIEFKHLWMAYRPGDLIYTLEDGIHRAMRLKSMEKGWGTWNLNLEKIAYDGKIFGHAEAAISIHWYDGYMPLTQLCAFPLQ
jgi:predicted ester cyclase